MKWVCIFQLVCTALFGATKERCEFYREFDHYLLLLQKWMSGMHEVAKWKWNHGLLEGDPTFEKQLIDHLDYLATTNGIPISWARDVIHAQVDAGNIVIAQDFELWQREEVSDFKEVWDLQSELHPYLCMITNEMFFLLGNLYPYFQGFEGDDALFQPPLSKRPLDQIPYNAWQKALSAFENRSK